MPFGCITLGHYVSVLSIKNEIVIASGWGGVSVCSAWGGRRMKVGGGLVEMEPALSV